VEKGLSFYPVQIKDTGIPIDKTVELPMSILTHPAKSPLAKRDVTLPGAEIALDFSSNQWGEIGGKFCLDKSFYGHSCPCRFWNTEQVSCPKGTESLPAKLQELTFCQAVHSHSSLPPVFCSPWHRSLSPQRNLRESPGGKKGCFRLRPAESVEVWG
jgi:hypothetical protein